MPKINKGDMIDAKAWDCLVITKVKASGVNICVKSFCCSCIPDYFSYNDIDGWSNGEVSLQKDGCNWYGYIVETGEDFIVQADTVIDAINAYNEGLVWVDL